MPPDMDEASSFDEKYEIIPDELLLKHESMMPESGSFEETKPNPETANEPSAIDNYPIDPITMMPIPQKEESVQNEDEMLPPPSIFGNPNVADAVNSAANKAVPDTVQMSKPEPSTSRSATSPSTASEELNTTVSAKPIAKPTNMKKRKPVSTDDFYRVQAKILEKWKTRTSNLISNEPVISTITPKPPNSTQRSSLPIKESPKAGSVLSDRRRTERNSLEYTPDLGGATLYHPNPQIEDDDGDGLFVPEQPVNRQEPLSGIGNKRKTRENADVAPEEQPNKRAKAVSGKRTKFGARKMKHIDKVIDSGPDMIGDLLTNDVFSDTAKTAHLGPQPVFGEHTRRNDVWKEMNANLEENEHAIVQQDQQAVNKAVSFINGNKNNSGRQSVQPHAGGTWSLKGIKTPLKSYQIMGVSFMRQREHSEQEPRGGLLCDGMGLGKTLQSLANIVNGRPPPGSKAKATLVVASPALIRQWLGEIEQHCYNRDEHKWGLGDVMSYYSGNRPIHSNLRKLLEDASIVLTTYHEVATSYPKATIPANLVTAQAKDEWWSQHFSKHCGVLHKVEWYRVCLDEAAVIKNDKCHTSMACRALKYKHAWAITGTPIMNNLGEFYSLFKFVRCPYTTTSQVFKENFEDGMALEGVEKLCYFLEEFMIRRTHADTLFNARILDLPKPKQSTIWIDFTPLEREIYMIVQDRIIEKINTIAAHEGIQKENHNGHVWNLILRLRQMCSHVLLIKDTIVDVLERSDFEKLNALCKNRAVTGKEGTALLKNLRNLLIQGKDTDNSIQGDEDSFSPWNHRRRGDEKCAKCQHTAVEAWKTSCSHVYCFDCLADVEHAAARKGYDSAKCIACDDSFASAHALPKPFDHTPLNNGSSSSRVRPQGNPPNRPQNSTRNNRKPHPVLVERHPLTLPSEYLSSAKTKAATSQISAWLAEDPACKIIVYAQFLETIDILSRICTANSWGHLRYVGTMSQAARSRSIELFGSEPEQNVLLASLKAGGIGLNLTMASRVLNLDPWFNLAVENQAFCRVFRIGQTRETRMARLVVKDSIDSAMHALKERKQVEIDAVMDGRGRKGGVGLRDLMRLLGKVREDGRGLPYIVKGALAKEVLLGGRVEEVAE